MDTTALMQDLIALNCGVPNNQISLNFGVHHNPIALNFGTLNHCLRNDNSRCRGQENRVEFN